MLLAAGKSAVYRLYIQPKHINLYYEYVQIIMINGRV